MLDASLSSDDTKRRASSARVGRRGSGLPSSEELQWVRENTEWERCSTTPRVARSVRLKNSNERRRLQTVRLSLDRQLERELRRLDFERNEFVEALERASGRPRTAVLRSGTSQLFEPREAQSRLSSPTATVATGLDVEKRPLIAAELGVGRLRVLTTPNTLCASEGCSPNNPSPKPLWSTLRSNNLPAGEVAQAKDNRSPVGSSGQSVAAVALRRKKAKAEGRGDRLSSGKPFFFLSSGEPSSLDIRRLAHLPSTPSLLRYHSAGALSKKPVDF
ncbi:hypothetical protein AAHC03_09606 [Spirometra sp. Aus1]